MWDEFVKKYLLCLNVIAQRFTDGTNKIKIFKETVSQTLQPIVIKLEHLFYDS